MSELTFRDEGGSYSDGDRYRVKAEGERELPESADNRLMNGLMVLILCFHAS